MIGHQKCCNINTNQDFHEACNEINTHSDNYFDGENWKLMGLYGKVDEVMPLLVSYDPTRYTSLGNCMTVWKNQVSRKEYLMVCDRMLLFGYTIPLYLLNTNHIWEYGIDVNDNHFDGRN